MSVETQSARPHPADVAVFVVTTALCALGALILPLAGENVSIIRRCSGCIWNR